MRLDGSFQQRNWASLRPPISVFHYSKLVGSEEENDGSRIFQHGRGIASIVDTILVPMCVQHCPQRLPSVSNGPKRDASSLEEMKPEIKCRPVSGVITPGSHATDTHVHLLQIPTLPRTFVFRTEICWCQDTPPRSESPNVGNMRLVIFAFNALQSAASLHSLKLPTYTSLLRSPSCTAPPREQQSSPLPSLAIPHHPSKTHKHTSSP